MSPWWGAINGLRAQVQTFASRPSPAHVEVAPKKGEDDAEVELPGAAYKPAGLVDEED